MKKRECTQGTHSSDYQLQLGNAHPTLPLLF